MDASWLANQLKANPNLEVVLEMNCRAFPDVEQGNVIANGAEASCPMKSSRWGAPLDSWDIGEGAHDDGAGIVHTLEVLRILKALGYTPRRTIRFVLFINEENGNRGARPTLRVPEDHTTTNLRYVAALESDAGGFVPRGFRIDAGDEATALISRGIRCLTRTMCISFDAGVPVWTSDL